MNTKKQIAKIMDQLTNELEQKNFEAFQKSLVCKYESINYKNLVFNQYIKIIEVIRDYTTKVEMQITQYEYDPDFADQDFEVKLYCDNDVIYSAYHIGGQFMLYQTMQSLAELINCQGNRYLKLHQLAKDKNKDINEYKTKPIL